MSNAHPGHVSEEATQLLLGAGANDNTIPSDVEALLNENRITFPRKHPDRRALALAILRAKIDAIRIVESRLRGLPIETPERPARLEAALVETCPCISKMWGRWIKLFEPGQKTIDDNQLYVGRFIEMFGDISVTAARAR